MTESEATSLREGRRDIARLCVRMVAFVTPLVLFVVVPICLIDPFHVFGRRGLVREEVRARYAVRVNEVLEKLPEFDRAPTPGIVLGDSQMRGYNAEAVAAVTGVPYTNLAYGGGSIKEMITTFWHAHDTTQLREVYAGLSFYSYVDNTRDRAAHALELMKSPIGYIFDGDVLEAGKDDAFEALFHIVTNYQPTASRDAFWNIQLASLERRRSTLPVSERLRGELSGVADACRREGIRFVIVVPPEHTDVRKTIRETGLQALYDAFKAEIVVLAEVVDCDVDNSVTANRELFIDPFHISHDENGPIVASVWGGDRGLCERHPYRGQQTASK